MPESQSAINYTKIGAYTRITEATTLSNGNRVFVGEDDGAAILKVFDDKAILLWEKRINHPGRNAFMAVAEMANGNLVVAGSTNSTFFNTNNQSADILIQCYTPSGDEVWTTVKGSENDEYILDLIIDSKGNCVMLGSVNSDFWLTFSMKIDADGAYIWMQEYYFDTFSEGRGLIELDNGQYMIVGTEGWGVDRSPYVARISANGILLNALHFSVFQRIFDKDRDDYPVNIIPSKNGYLISLFYLPNQRVYPTLQLIEVDPTGQFLQVKELFGLGTLKPMAMRKDGSGFLICGASSTKLDYKANGFSESTSFVIRIDENLDVDWQSSWGASELIQTAFDVSRKGDRISVGALSQVHGLNSASLLHYWLDENGNPIYKNEQE